MIKKLCFSTFLAFGFITLIACSSNFIATTQETILVGGSTGRQGTAVVGELIKRGYRVRAMTRNPSSKKAMALANKYDVEIFEGDYADFDSLLIAMRGVNKVFFYTSPLSRNELLEGNNVISAAKESGVKHLVYSSGAAAEPGNGIPGAQMDIELAIVSSGLNFTVLRPVAFMENIDRTQKRIAKNGIVDSREPSRMLYFISIPDIGFYVGEAFNHPKRWKGVAMNIAGDSMTINEYVMTVGAVMGRSLSYRRQPLESYLAAKPKFLRTLFRWYDNVGYTADVDSARKEFPKLITLDSYLRSTGWENWQE
ncbi:MAG: NmrA family NAD(P)-binding protein [Pseudomonadota bacterium]|nr:NmrA family NAD(P)-binding protein [Pseudomonadota bacterium]